MVLLKLSFTSACVTRVDAAVSEGCVQRFKSLGHAQMLIRGVGRAILVGLHGEWSCGKPFEKSNQFADMKRFEDDE